MYLRYDHCSLLATSELRKRSGKSEVDNASWDCFRGRKQKARPQKQSRDALSTSLLPGLLRNSEVANITGLVFRLQKWSHRKNEFRVPRWPPVVSKCLLLYIRKDQSSYIDISGYDQQAAWYCCRIVAIFSKTLFLFNKSNIHSINPNKYSINQLYIQ